MSTDDAEIADVAREYGAEVIDRPAEFATDTSPDIDCFFHALTHLRARYSYVPQFVAHLRPTMPIRRDGDIDKAIEMIMVNPADSLRSVSLAKQSIYKMWSAGPDGFIHPIYNDDIKHTYYNARYGSHGKPAYVPYCGEQHSKPRQTLPQVYHQNGYVDVIRSNTILRDRLMAGTNVLPFIVEHRLFEIDYVEQIAEAEAEIKRLQGFQVGEGWAAFDGELCLYSEDGIEMVTWEKRHAV